MNEELAMRSLAYLMGDYKEQDEVILNDEDIEAIKYLQKQNEQLQNNWNELKEWLEEEIYNIEPKGTVINYNCEYDSEEDYINAMKERSKLITLKRVLIMLQELEQGKDE